MKYIHEDILGMTKNNVTVDDKLRVSEEKYQESEQRFRSLADTAPVFIWLSDMNNLGTYFSKPWLEFTGRTLEQELGAGWTEAMHPDDLERAAAYCQKSFNARKEFRMEFRLRRHDGKYRWVLDHGVPRYDPDGSFLGYIGSCLDIEDFKRSLKRQERLEATNLSLKKQRAQLLALNDAKDEFISIASHQLRTPTTTVKQYLGMLLEGYAGNLSDEQLSMIMTAYDNNERQLKIITDLLRVAHVDAGKVRLVKSETDLSQLIGTIIKDMHAIFSERHQKVAFNRPETLTTAQIDARLLRMVLENILENASKYSPSNSLVKVRLSPGKQCTVIEVADKGVGIDKKDQEKLFQKFSRIDNPLSATVGGTGLGLYWVKKIIDLHGGSVGLTSEPKRGTTFSISLPH